MEEFEKRKSKGKPSPRITAMRGDLISKIALCTCAAYANCKGQADPGANPSLIGAAVSERYPMIIPDIARACITVDERWMERTAECYSLSAKDEFAKASLRSAGRAPRSKGGN